MRKLHLLLVWAVMVFMTSCGVPQYVDSTPNHITKKTTFDKAIRSVQSQLESRGFKYLGYETTKPAFQMSKVKTTSPKHTRQDSYLLIDSLGNTLRFTVAGNFKSGGSVKDVKLCDCEVSNPIDSVKLCGNEGVIRQTLQKKNYHESIRSLQTHLGNQGFKLTSVESVLTHPYDDLFKDTHYFADSLGNTMNYSVIYSQYKSQDGGGNVRYAELGGCETSNPYDFEKFYGEEDVFKPLKALPKDRDIRAEKLDSTMLGLLALVLVFAPTIITAIIVL